MRQVAFHAPMKPPGHPTPSGDRRVARLFLTALQKAGYDPRIASDLRTRDGKGDAEAQAVHRKQATHEIDRLSREWEGHAPPALWFTYHCYYKAPDLIGPALADRFGIPYVIAEASRARKRLTGPWADYAAAAEAAIDRADLLLAMTAHDRFALDRDATPGQRVADFPPFLDPGPAPATRKNSGRLDLLTVAMMRGADKVASYRALADILRGFDAGDWHLTIIGDGPQRAEVVALFAEFGGRVTLITTIIDADRLRQHYEQADILVWPGVNEAYGMVYLEAQAAGTPVVAQDWPGPRSVIAPASAIVPTDDPAAFRDALNRLGGDASAREAVRAHIVLHHGIDAAAARLSVLLGDLL